MEWPQSSGPQCYRTVCITYLLFDCLLDVCHYPDFVVSKRRHEHTNMTGTFGEKKKWKSIIGCNGYKIQCWKHVDILCAAKHSLKAHLTTIIRNRNKLICYISYNYLLKIIASFDRQFSTLEWWLSRDHTTWNMFGSVASKFSLNCSNFFPGQSINLDIFYICFLSLENNFFSTHGNPE